MKLHMNGPAWVAWTVWAFMLLITILFLCGKGSGLIAGFNTMSDNEKELFDKKKLCHVMGKGFLVLDCLIPILLLGENVFPAWTAYVFLGIVLIDIAYMVYASNVKCKKE